MERALDAGVVASQAVQPDGELGVFDEVHIVSGGVGEGVLHAADSAQLPGGGHDFVEQRFLQSRRMSSWSCDCSSSNSSRSSKARTISAEVSPCLRAFCEERALPSSVRGPVLRSALAELAIWRASDVIVLSFGKLNSGLILGWVVAS